MQYKCKKCGWVGEVERPHCKRCAQRAVRDWENRNPEKRNEYRRNWQRKYREEHRLEYNAKQLKKRTPERSKEIWRRRIEWLAQGDVTREQLIDIYRKMQGLCEYCSIKVSNPRFTPTDPRGFDHIKARVNGGLHTAQNIVVCCQKCNAKKGAMNKDELD